MTRSALLGEYRRLLEQLERVYRDFEGGITPARPFPAGSRGSIIRLPVRNASHAIILKLAAMINFLYGALELCESGLVLGQGALERMADEAGEDVAFLALGLINGMTPRHHEFLDYFWREDFTDFDDIPGSFQSRPQVPRQKIVAAIHSISANPSAGNAAAKVLSKSYSGFVHASAPCVMEIYDPRQNRFGVSEAPEYRRSEHENDLWNYMYRGANALMFAAKAFGSQRHFDLLKKCLDEFQRRTGRRGDD